MSSEEFKALLLGKVPEGEGKLVRVEHYAKARERILSGMESVRNTVTRGLCN